MKKGNVSLHHDLLSIIISAHDDDEDHMAIDEDINDNIMLLMFVGNDTIISTLTTILKYLFMNMHCLHEVIKGELLVRCYF